jgi:hypothetical protein
VKDWMSQSQLHGPSIGTEPWGILDISFLSKSEFLAVMSGEGPGTGDFLQTMS